MRYFIVAAVTWMAGVAGAAGANRDSLAVEVEMSGTASNGKFAPMWTSANRFGMTGNKSKNGYLSAGIDYSLMMKHSWRIDAGAELAGGLNTPEDVWLQQLYWDVSWQCLTLSIGSRERANVPMEKNVELTSGWMTEGANNRPLPQVRGEIKEYWSVPGTRKWLALKGHLAYGSFIDGSWQYDFAAPGRRYTKDSRYHSKSLMFRLGNKDVVPVDFEFGLLMATQFAGDLYTKQKDGTSKLVTDMPDDLGAYWAAFFPTAGGDDTPLGEQVNVEGNMLGSWNFALNCYLGDWRVRATLDHYFEDHSQMFWEYGRWKDGQLGIEVYMPENRWVSAVLWEGMSTKDSSGPVLYDGFLGSFSDIQWSCGDDYFNNHIYQAWHHFGQGIGHGMIPGPAYNSDGKIIFKSNRIRMQHVGIMGNPTNEWSWRLLATYARHWGSYSAPFDSVKKQFSGMAEVNYTPTRLKHWDFKLAFAMDRGQYPGNSTGATMTVRYRYINR